MTDGEAGEGDQADGGEDYGGLLGAIPFAFRRSQSRLLRSYVVVGGLVTAFVAIAFVLSIVVLLGRTIGTPGGTFTFSRAFVVVVALFVVGPLLAPIVSTARRHRHGTADRRTDALVAALGYGIIALLYVALVISTPAELRDPADGPIEEIDAIVEALYALPAEAVAVPLAMIALTTVAVWRIHRRAGQRNR